MSAADAPVGVEPAISRTIAEFALGLSWDQVPDTARAQSKRLILDALGVAIAASHYPFARTMSAGLTRLGALDGCAGRSRVIGSSTCLPLRDAVVMNGGLIHGLDFDDTHLEAIVHATAVALPTALSVGEMVDASGRRLLEAYLAAMEVAIRVGMSAKSGFHHHGLHATGVVGHFSSAVASGMLFGLSAAQIAVAQGIVGSTAMASQEFLAEGAWNKRLHPGWAAVAGITAAKLAESGFVAPTRPYEGKFGLFRSLVGTEEGAFDIGKMTQGLGQVWEIERVAVKPFPTCHATHAHADCALILRKRHSIDPAAIARIEVRLPSVAFALVAEPRDAKIRPTSEYAGKFSVQYIVAAALHRGKFELAELESDCLADPQILATAAKVFHVNDPDTLFPEAISGGVKIFMNSGEVFDHYEAVNRGCGKRALTETEVVEKFMSNVSPLISPLQARALCAMVLDLEHHDARSLMKALSSA